MVFKLLRNMGNYQGCTKRRTIRHGPRDPTLTRVRGSNTGILDNKRNSELSESGERPRVTVKLKRGAWEIEINTTEDMVQQTVESVLAGMASKEQVLVDPQEPRGEERKGETSRSVLTAMWKEGWFSTSRSLSEVHEEMSRRGYHYDRTAVSHTLVDLVREGSLFRDGSMRNYRYVQKYPFKGQTGTS